MARPTSTSHTAEAELVRRLRAQLPDHANWDGEGSRGYSDQVVERAVTLLLDALRTGVEMPDVGPGPEGSVDLHWDAEGYELLINVPADPRSPPTFYGDNKGPIQVKGTLDESGPGAARLIALLGGRA